MAVHSPKRHEDLLGLSLCAGVGGLDLGLHLAEPGYRTVGFVERNSFAAATLVARMADSSLAPAPVWDDLRSFDGRPWRRRVHIITAGYPCQPFSLAGLRKGEEDPRHLWPDVARIVGEVGPEWCFFENVPGHLSLGLDDVAGNLQDLGFRVAACVLSAAEAGAPHVRDRLFILAHSDRQKRGKPRLRRSDGQRPGVPPRSESIGQAVGTEDRGLQLDHSVGPAEGHGVAAALPSVFPPGPADFEDWGLAIDARPDLKPCLLRLGDGLASGLDRTAAAGNGVVPLAAARAWRILRQELEGV